MQVLAQAGLPIPCESAEITPFSQLATEFSEAEKEFCEGNDAGRFEQEVRELAEMVDTLKEGSLVFLNETFQSTAYAEGAEGLYHLLKYFSALNIRWILVSHLRQLEEMFDNNEATILHTSDGYKIN
jgi:DNA mismatch repair ATPase MutS